MSGHRIIPRSEWGARWGSGWGTRPLPATQAWLHRPAMYGSPGVGSTLAEDAAHVRRIEDVGRSRFRDADFAEDGTEAWKLPLGSGISYTYVISRSGRIFAGHDPARQSSHTKGHNLAGVGIALADGPSEDTPPTQEQIEACAWLLTHLIDTGVLTRPRLDGGHRDTAFPTSCPTAAHAAIPQINALTGGTMPRAENGWDTIPLSSTATFLAPNGKIVYCHPAARDILAYVAWRWHLSVGPIAPATNLEGDPAVRQGAIIAIHAWRPAAQIAGSNVYSNHGTGLALDVNGHLHPYEFTAPKPYRTGFTYAQEQALRRIKTEVRALAGGVDLLRLGLDFPVGRRDGMHVELWGALAQVQAASAAVRASGWVVPWRRGDISAYQGMVGTTADDFHGAGTTRVLQAAQRDRGLEQTGRWDLATQTTFVQEHLTRLGYDVGKVDGIPGRLFDLALRAFQRTAGQTPDGIPGRDTLRALLRTATPKPPTTPPTTPPVVKPDPPKAPPAVPVHRVAGSNRFDTAALASAIALPKGLGVILYVDDTADAASAVLLGSRTGHTTLPVRADQVPAPIARRLAAIAPAWVAVVGGPLAFPETTAQAAAQAAATK